MTGVQHKIVGTGWGVASAYICYKGLGDPYGVLLIPTAMVGCMLPDMDHDMTKLGRKRKVVTKVTGTTLNALVLGGVVLACILAIVTLLGLRDYGFSANQFGLVAIGLIVFMILKKFITNSNTYKWATKHRGLMHTLLMPVLLYFGMGISDFPLWHYTFLGLCVGYCSHLFADSLTVEGCPLLWPIYRKNIRFLKLRTKEKSCTYAAWIVCIASIAVGYIYTGGL